MMQIYETAALEKFKDAIPNLKQIIVTSEMSQLIQMNKVLQFPSMQVLRKTDEGAINHRSFDIETETGVAKVFIFNQLYEGKVFFQKEGQAMRGMSDIRFLLEKNPYVNLDLGDDFKLDIGMRVLYIKKEEELDGDNSRGGRRYVSVAWQSSIPIVDHQTYPLITTVRLKLLEENTIIEFR